MQADLDMMEDIGEAAVRARFESSGLYPALKRALDVVVSLAAIAVTAPLWILIAIVIKLDSRGAVIFRQRRIGLHAREFVLYKFRSMLGSADADLDEAEFHRYAEGEPLHYDDHGPVYKKINDPRITRVGKLLRATNLDELPQLINVLRGEMSIVGPRPMLPYHLDLYKSWYHQRHQVPQGITGLWQLKARNRVDLEDMVRWDLEYIKRSSLLLDFWLILLTIPGMLMTPKGDGRCRRSRE